MLKSLLIKLRNLFRQKKYTSISFERMWFLDEKTNTLESRGLSTMVEKALRDIRDNGIAIIPGNISHEICDAVVRDFNTFVRKSKVSHEYRDEHSLHERLCNLQMISEAARHICFNERTAEIVQAAFSSPYVVVGSLLFEKGSTQSIHRDTPAFFTNPLNHYFGIWNALEDVRLGSGPLIYYKGGHKIAPDEYLYLDNGININNYFSFIEDACKTAGLELIEYYPKKGDTLIWHPQLSHGGGKITSPGLSRRSFVFHCIPRGCPIYGAEKFFDSSHTVPVLPPYKTIRYGNYEILDQGNPRFFHNRYEGNFDEH